MTSFDTPPEDDVFQEDETSDIVPVSIDGVVRVDEMPTELGMLGNILLPTGGQPVKVLSANPRRKRIIAWIYYAGTAPANTLIGAMLGRSFAECSGFTGPVLWSMNAITRYEFSFQSELWARGVNVENTLGVVDGIVVSTNDVLINVVTEDWAR
jgi:hypothetical protein